MAQQAQAEAGFLAPSQKQFTHTKRKRGWVNIFLVCKFEHHVRLCCPRFWKLWPSLKEWWYTVSLRRPAPRHAPSVGLFSALKIKTLIINTGAPAHLCDTLCFINKTSNAHIRFYNSTILGCETNSNNSCTEMESHQDILPHNKRSEWVLVTATTHNVKEHSEEGERITDCRRLLKNTLRLWNA